MRPLAPFSEWRSLRIVKELSNAANKGDVGRYDG
jgi:hypothetical protein